MGVRVVAKAGALRTLQSAVIAALLVCFSEPAFSQNFLTDSGVKVQRHDKRPSKVVFPEKGDPLAAFGFLFQKNIFEPLTYLDSHVLQYEELPQCRSSEVKLIPVYHNTPGSEVHDVLFFNPADPEQRAQAKAFPSRTVAYNPALVRDPTTHLLDYWQEFARLVEIDCLPTRFHFVQIGSKRYIEYRMGSEAWNDRL